MNIKLFLLSILATVTMTSCSENTDSPSIGGKGLTQIMIETGEFGSRSIESGYGGTKAIYGLKMHINKFQGVNGTLAYGSPLDIVFSRTPSGASVAVDLGPTTKSIWVRANYDTQVIDAGTPQEIVLSDNVNTRQRFECVLLSDTTNLDIFDDGESHSAAINLVPEMARVEIISNSKIPTITSPTRTDITISAVYINNVKLTRDGKINKTVGDLTSWNEAYNKLTPGSKYGLFDEGSWSCVLGQNNLFGFAKVLGFNIFTQAGTDPNGTPTGDTINAKKMHPHVIFKVSYTEDSQRYENMYLTITNFANASGLGFIDYFDAGSIYQFDIASIYKLIAEGTTVSPVPDPETTSLSVGVAVKKWDVINVDQDV